MNKNIKISYKKPMLFLHNSNKVRQAILTNNTLHSAFNIVETFKVNETAQLSLSIPFENTKITFEDCEKLIKKGFEYYIIKEISLNSSNTRVMDIRCDHESVELKGILNTPLDMIGVTAREMFNGIMTNVNQPTGYQFKGTDIPDSTKRHLQIDSEVSVFENLVSMAKVFNAWLEFSTDSNGNKFIFLRKDPLERGKFIKKGNGLRSLDITYSSDEVFTRMYAFGETDNDGVELNIMGVNPTGKSYVENYDYYLAKGMSMEEILSNPRCLQESVYRNSDIIDENDLFRIATEEIVKASAPILDGNISMVDLSVFEGSSLLTPIIGERIVVLDKDIKFNIGATITGVERNYDNPMDTKITISNIIRYNSIFKDLVHQGEVLDKMTSTGEDGKTEFHANFIKGIIDGNKAHFQSMIDSAENLGTISLLFECRVEGHELNGAVGIGTKGLCCSDELDSKGEWIWKTGVTGSGINATLITAGVLNASIIRAGILKSFNNKTWINMQDGTFNFADKIKFENNKFTIDLSNEGLATDSELNGVKTNLQTQITVQAGEISQKVSSDTYNSNKTQTDQNISQRVSKGNEFSAEFNHNATAFNFSLGDGNCNVEINKNGQIIRNGALIMENSKGQNTLVTDANGNINMNMWGTRLSMSATGDRKTQLWNDVNDRFHIAVPFYNANAGFRVESDTGIVFLEANAGLDYTYLPRYTIASSFGTKGALHVGGNFTCSGSKNSLQKTESYGKRLINSYETAEYYFGDIGSGVIKNGECVVAIDDVLLECINTKVGYHIFTQVYNGTIKNIKRFYTYFIVYGEDDTEFSWELKAKRIGYENNRLDLVDIYQEQSEHNNYFLLEEQQEINKNSEDLLLGGN